MVKTNYEAACAVLDGKYGNGMERKELLEADGFNYSAVQSIVNCLVKDRNRDAAQGNFGKYMEVEVDLSEYDGINLKFKQKG